MARSTSTFLFVILFSISLNAQFGIKVGANFAKWHVSSDEAFGELNTKMDFGPMAGLYYNFNFDEFSDLRISTLFTVKGAKQDPLFSDESYDFSYLEVDLEYHYKIVKNDKFSTSILAGPYLGYGLKGVVRFEGNSEEIELTKDNGFNRLDFGMNLGLGLNYGHLEFQLIYGFGVGNLAANPEGFDEFRITNRNFTFALGYFFGSAKTISVEE